MRIAAASVALFVCALQLQDIVKTKSNGYTSNLVLYFHEIWGCLRKSKFLKWSRRSKTTQSLVELPSILRID